MSGHIDNISEAAEYWDLYDKNINSTGEIIRRGDAIPDGKYHLVCEVITVDSNGRLLLTKRHPDKPFPLLWECSGGSVVSGEAPIDGAVRELFEETGIKAEKEELIDLGVTYGSHAIYFNYLLRRDIDLGAVVLQAGETVDVRLADKEQYQQLAAAGQVVPTVADRFSVLDVCSLLR